MKKVSVLSPCYNVAKYLPKYLDSIIAQNYSPIELILVNDGSTDNTAEVIDGYRQRLTENDIELKYIYKENGGLASAIAMGLKYVSGDYLIWPDPDDFLLENSISSRVEYMESHPDCGLLRTNGYKYNENDLENPVSEISKIKKTVTLKDYMNFIVPWCCGCYMMRVKSLETANPNRYITFNAIGQNIQMLLPVVYYYPCHYYNIFSYGYVVYNKSMSHSIDTYEKRKKYLHDMEQSINETLDIIPENTDEYLEINKRFFRYTRYKTAWQYGEKEDMRKYEIELREHKEFDTEAFIVKHMKKSALSDFLIKSVSKIRRMFEK